MSARPRWRRPSSNSPRGFRSNLIIPGINGTDAIPLAAVFAHTPALQITSAAEAQLDQPAKYLN